MNGGGKEPYAVPFHNDGDALRIKYLHDLENSIKARTPLPGEGITIIRTDAGSTIKFSNATTCQILSFNVCSGGLPDTVAVLCVVTKPNFLYENDEPISYVPITSYV